MARVKCPTKCWFWPHFRANTSGCFRTFAAARFSSAHQLRASNCRTFSSTALWTPQDSIATVHRHVVPSLFCVPSVGAPLLDLPQDHSNALRGWLGFYRRHQAIFNRGEFRAHWAAGDFQSFDSTLGDQRIIASFSRYPVVLNGGGETWVINATDGAGLLLHLDKSAQISLEDAEGRPYSTAARVPAGLQEIDCSVGAIARFTFD